MKKTKITTKLLAILFAGTLSVFNVIGQTLVSGTASNGCTTVASGTGSDATAIGCGANAGSGNYNTVVGNTAGSAMTGTANVCMGYSVGVALTSGTNNTFVGAGSGVSTTSVSANTFIGAGAGLSNVSGAFGTLVGTGAGQLATGGNNTCMGYHAGYNCGVNNNVAVGANALYTLGGAYAWGNAANDVAVGNAALYNTINAGNTGLGYEAGYYNTSGGSNTYLGFSTGPTSGNGTNSYNTFVGYGATEAGDYTNGTAIGYDASVCASNTMEFGNSSVIGWGFGGACPTGTVALIVGTGSTNGNGAYLSTGGAWTNTSDRDKKENIKEVEGQDILKKINSLSISSWNYKGEQGSPKHIGPMAQDFYKIFAVGNDDKSISTIDPAGVALAGIKELSKHSTSQAAEIESLKTQIAQLTQLVNAMGGLNNSSANDASRQAVQLTNATAVVLNQNVPNPFAEQTIINYSIPQTAAVAQILFYDMAGQLIKTTDITTRGVGQLNVFANDLSNGNYSYTLVIDGKIIDTKKMVKQQ